MFETNIRLLGGLLAAYDLSGREVLLQKAVELDPACYSCNMNVGAVALAFRDYKAANAAFTKAAGLEPNNFEVHLMSAYALAGLKKAPEAAQAFEDLRGEVSLLRRAVERLAAERAGDGAAPDYSETLGVIANNITATAQRVDALVNSPALALTPHELNRQIVEIGTAGRSEDRRAIAAARQVIEDVATKLARQLDSHVMADDQRRRLWRSRLTGLAAGMVVWAIVAGPIVRSMPASWLLPERMAARSLRMPMWEAGQRLMRAGDAQAFAGVLAGNRLAVANRETLEACRKRANKVGGTARCAVSVEPDRQTSR